MPTFPFVKFTPTGNPTILVSEKGGSLAARARLAKAILHPLHLGAEQVGFVDLSTPLPRLDMMGGEFCVNATRCLAVMLAEKGLLRMGRDGWFRGEATVSGMDSPLALRVRPQFEAAAQSDEWADTAMSPLPDVHELYDMPACYESEVELPLHGVEVHPCGPGLFLVRMPGITHLVLDRARHDFPAPEALVEVCAAWRRRHDLEGEDAAGCIWFDRYTARIDPVVWVRGTDSTCYESACGSGTLAVALACVFAHPQGSGTARLMQPAGEALTVIRNADKASVWICGSVRVVAQGWVRVDWADARPEDGQPC